MEHKTIRGLRKNKGLTLEDLSVAAGVSKSYISYIERGVQKNPSIAVLIKIANVLDIEYVELIQLIHTEEGKREVEKVKK
ncbi:helix-turn-helix domain-containing protein [Alkalihalobacillus pseudalcaliphilus]|uniref:helix-turn-helix domain-containing protein n=1 Tax=Alkalihalobacillus pseudalcaliphilus TaxID=79884 RepID=UPI00069E819D|nr:helix-turn-helix transcriptional regulator [Alkalihalobacillus pseudalcaliphilus]